MTPEQTLSHIKSVYSTELDKISKRKLAIHGRAAVIILRKLLEEASHIQDAEAILVLDKYFDTAVEMVKDYDLGVYQDSKSRTVALKPSMTAELRDLQFFIEVVTIPKVEIHVVDV